MDKATRLELIKSIAKKFEREERIDETLGTIEQNLSANEAGELTNNLHLAHENGMNVIFEDFELDD